jgi:alpha-L-rhamnosidase
MRITAIGTLCLAALACLPLAAALTPTHLRTEYRTNPVGVDIHQPRLSWIVEAASPAERNQRQTAYRLLVASRPEILAAGRGDLWDSGRLTSAETLHIAYAGKPLVSGTQCYWKVRVWDAKGQPSPWSQPALWSMGLLDPAAWHAQWISDPAAVIAPAEVTTLRNRPATEPVAMLRKTVILPGPVRRATLYATARGLYELRLNGARVGDALLAPEWTSYQKRLQYQTYDVTQSLRAGPNALGALVAQGWYAGRVGLFSPRQLYGSQPALLLRLDIELASGRKLAIVSDATWRRAPACPIVTADLLDGETYDARRELPGWDTARFDDAAWAAAVPSTTPAPQQLVWQRGEPIRVERELKPVRVTEPDPGTYIFDLGQNMVGWCRFRLHGEAGSPVTFRYGEILGEDGRLYVANLRGAKATDVYIPRSAAAAVFEPHFTYHGFRYVEVKGLAQPPALADLTGRVFHSSSPEAGTLETSSAMLNQLTSNIRWTLRGNLVTTPTDCPQRDERLGWMGDAQIFSQTAIFNLDVAAFFTKFLTDVRDDQLADGRFPDFAPNPESFRGGSGHIGAPGWGDAGVILPWRLWVAYGDKRLLEEHYAAARQWVEFIHRNNPGLLWKTQRSQDYGEWLNADTFLREGWPAKGGAMPKEMFATCYFAHSTELLAKMAAVLGKDADARAYRELFAQIRAAFLRAYVQPDGAIDSGTQAAYALALHFNLLPDNLRPAAIERIEAGLTRYGGHLSTGIHATNPLLLELVREGHTATAYRLVNLRSFPSWGYMIGNGATTIWERWDGYVKGRGPQNPGMNSFNHWALGSVGEWMWRVIAGLHPDEAAPGFAHFTVRPLPGGGLTSATATYDSVRGRIRIAWKLEGPDIALDVAVPPNTTATVYVPTQDAASITEGAKPAVSTGAGVFQIGSGNYHFRARYQPPPE